MIRKQNEKVLEIKKFESKNFAYEGEANAFVLKDF
jgi:hypothetical protein